jgi:hypothetical protein
MFRMPPGRMDRPAHAIHRMPPLTEVDRPRWTAEPAGEKCRAGHGGVRERLAVEPSIAAFEKNAAWRAAGFGGSGPVAAGLLPEAQLRSIGFAKWWKGTIGEFACSTGGRSLRRASGPLLPRHPPRLRRLAWENTEWRSEDRVWRPKPAHH